MEKVNPFKERQTVDESRANILYGKLSVAFMKKPGGLLFKLFDLGTLSFQEDNRLKVYKDRVGDSVRKFLANIKIGNDPVKCYEALRYELFKTARLGIGDDSKHNLFCEAVDEILMSIEEEF